MKYTNSLSIINCYHSIIFDHKTDARAIESAHDLIVKMNNVGPELRLFISYRFLSLDRIDEAGNSMRIA